MKHLALEVPILPEDACSMMNSFNSPTQKVIFHTDTVFYALLDANKQKEVLSVKPVPSVYKRNKNRLCFQK